jgi:hypothetical protein
MSTEESAPPNMGSIREGTPTEIRGSITGEISRIRPYRQVLGLQIAIALTVWILWLAIGRSMSISSMEHYWRISVTMIFGSLVGGGTSEGGGAVAFPVLTKVLRIPAPHARLFGYFSAWHWPLWPSAWLFKSSGRSRTTTSGFRCWAP